MTRQRNINLDFIRVVAVFTVLSVHFFWNIGFYGTPMLGRRMYIGTIARTFCMVCVPLFLLLTGYLMNKKVLSKKYYGAIVKVIVVYLISTILMLIFQKYYLKQTLSLRDVIANILSFQQYSWYVGMYIGLFIMIPFLNIVFNSLDLKGKRILICTMCVLTIMPTTFNYFDFLERFWDVSSKNHIFPIQIFPDFYMKIYPVTYYLIGAYIRDQKENVLQSKIINWILLIITVVLFGTYNFYLGHHQNFIWNSTSDWGGLENTIDSVLLFCLLLKIKFLGQQSSLNRVGDIDRGDKEIGRAHV